MACLAICFGISNTCGDVWLNRVGQNRETTEEHDDDCVEGFQLARVKLDKDGEEGWEAQSMGNRSINIWDGTELELAWSKKSSSHFENNFPIFFLRYFKYIDIWGASVDLLVMKPSLIFSVPSSVGAGNIWIYLMSYLFLLLPTSFIYIKSFFITITVEWCFCWYCWWWRVFFSFLLKLNSQPL